MQVKGNHKKSTKKKNCATFATGFRDCLEKAAVDLASNPSEDPFVSEVEDLEEMEVLEEGSV